MSERHDKQAQFVRNPLDTKTTEVIAAIVTLVCVAGAAVIVVAAVMGWLPW